MPVDTVQGGLLKARQRSDLLQECAVQRYVMSHGRGGTLRDHLVCLRVHCPRGVNLKRVNVYFYSPTVLSPLTTEMHAQTRLNGLLITDLARRAQTDLDVKWR
jgi:hypothetical protein